MQNTGWEKSDMQMPDATLMRDGERNMPSEDAETNIIITTTTTDAAAWRRGEEATPAAAVARKRGKKDRRTVAAHRSSPTHWRWKQGPY